jgi:hypothetical protein
LVSHSQHIFRTSIEVTLWRYSIADATKLVKKMENKNNNKIYYFEKNRTLLNLTAVD